jgi:hypothetical protein
MTSQRTRHACRETWCRISSPGVVALALALMPANVKAGEPAANRDDTPPAALIMSVAVQK